MEGERKVVGDCLIISKQKSQTLFVLWLLSIALFLQIIHVYFAISIRKYLITFS